MSPTLAEPDQRPSPALPAQRRREPQEWSDEVVLSVIRAGDPRGFAELYRRHHAGVRRFARSLVGPADVDDLVSESFAKMLRAMRADNGPHSHPIRYLMVTVRTTAATLHADRARRSALDDRLHADRTFRPDDGPGRDDTLITAFRTLKPRWQHVIWWQEIEGRSPVEIGEQLGVSAQAASALAYRARRALREAYLADPDHQARLDA